MVARSSARARAGVPRLQCKRPSTKRASTSCAREYRQLSLQCNQCRLPDETGRLRSRVRHSLAVAKSGAISLLIYLSNAALKREAKRTNGNAEVV